MKAIRDAVGLVLLTAGLNTATGQDTIHVRAGAPRWGSNVGLSQLYSIGGPPEYGIRVFYGMAVDNANRVYVHDLNPQEGNPQVSAYDANGKFVRKIGQKGAGPGEYRTITGMTVIEDSILAALDISNARITLFQPDGQFVRSIPMIRFVSAEVWFALPSDTANLLYLHYRARINGPDGNPAPNLAPEMRGRYLRMRPDGQIVDSIIDPPLDELGIRQFRYSFTNNFVPEVSIQASAVGGIVFGRGDTYRFTIQPIRGPVRVVEREWKPIALTSDERAEWIAYADFRAKREGKGSYEIPRTKPAYQEIYVDRDGRIWVSLFTAAIKRELPPLTNPNSLAPRISWAQQPVYDVYDPSGQYLGKVTFPFGSSMAGAHSDRVWLKSDGPDGEHLLTAYKLTGMRSRP